MFAFRWNTICLIWNDSSSSVSSDIYHIVHTFFGSQDSSFSFHLSIVSKTLNKIETPKGHFFLSIGISHRHVVPFSQNGTPEFAFIACHQRHAPLMLTHLPPFPLPLDHHLLLLFVASCYTRRVLALLFLAAKSSGIFIRGDRGQHKSTAIVEKGGTRERRDALLLLDGARELVNFSRPCCPPRRGTNGRNSSKPGGLRANRPRRKWRYSKTLSLTPPFPEIKLCKELFCLEFSSLNESSEVCSCSRTTDNISFKWIYNPAGINCFRLVLLLCECNIKFGYRKKRRRIRLYTFLSISKK